MAIPIPSPESNLPHLREQRPLAHAEGLGSVTQCACGTLSLNVQAFSLRLDLRSFAQLLLMCSEAMEVMEDHMQEEATVASALVH